MTVQEHVSLAPLTTFRVGGPARYFLAAREESEVQQALEWAKAQQLPVAVLGGGSNLLVPDAGFDGLVLRLEMRGIVRDADVFAVAAGESWDTFVNVAIASGCAGVECLAGIPGSVGATPVQNVGAYGQEVAQTVTSVRALDRRTGKFVEMNTAQCGFRYRRSVFNSEERGRYIITRVRFQLKQDGKPYLGYADLQRWFKDQKESPSLAAVAAAVRSIRGQKGMVLAEGDPDTWSAGSYFKNPVVPGEALGTISGAAGLPINDIPHWAAGEGQVKLSAAWLLEQAGFRKGFRLGAAGLSTKHALALTNRGGATCADILGLEEAIRSGVRQQFGVVLEREPVMLGAEVR